MESKTTPKQSQSAQHATPKKQRQGPEISLSSRRDNKTAHNKIRPRKHRREQPVTDATEHDDSEKDDTIKQNEASK